MQPVSALNTVLPLADSPQRDAPANVPHWPALNGLRGLAVLAVVAFHADLPLSRGGVHGVDVFLVLSGFLITTLLVREHLQRGAIRLGRFYLRRSLRLFPALAAVLAGCWLYTRLTGLGPERVALEHDLPGILLFFYNWCELLQPPRSPLACHLWSLSVEEQFYFVWPGLLMVLLAWRLRRRWVLAVALVGLVVPPVLRVIWFGLAHSYYGTDSRLDALAAGCIIGLLAGWGAPLSRWIRQALPLGGWMAAVMLLGHLLLSPNGRYSAYLGQTLCTVVTTTLIAALVWNPSHLLARLLAWTPLSWVGCVSYGSYLWHLPVQFVALRVWGFDQSTAHRLLWVVASVALGAASYYLLERPFLTWKSRLDRGTSAATKPHPTTVPRTRAA